MKEKNKPGNVADSPAYGDTFLIRGDSAFSIIVSTKKSNYVQLSKKSQ